MDHYYAVIMAGGGGTRLWPMSRRNNPKQVLKFIEKKSLFKISIERLMDLFPLERIYVVTIAEQKELLQKEVPALPGENYIIEPMPRGTASVVGLAATYLQKKDNQAVMAVLTADHIIKNTDSFKSLLTEGYQLAQKDLLVTLGITPSFSSTGYGYIEIGSKIENSNGYFAKRFVEKPDRETAERYLQSGNYLWNSGMFVWKCTTVLDEIKKQMPDLSEKLELIYERINYHFIIEPIHSIWETIQPQTIDYGIMERAPRVAVLPAAHLGWNDIGSWDSLYEFSDADQSGNLIDGDHIIEIGTENSIIYATDTKKMIAVVGMKDVIIISHENAVLICKKGESQRVKEVIRQIKEKKLNQFL